MILITGSAGYIGSEICKKFEKSKKNYIGIDDLKYSYKENVYNKKKFIKACISDNNTISKIIKKHKISFILHTAAFAYVNDAEKNKKKYFNNNVTKTKKFILNIKKHNVKNFIFLSSSNVYSEKKDIKKFYENHSTNPKNFYGKTKLKIEKFLFQHKKSFDNLIILRLFNIIGLTKNFKAKEFDNFKSQRLLFKFFRSIKKKIPITIRYISKKSGNYIFPSRDFLDIKDLTFLIKKILKFCEKKRVCDIYNVGSGKTISLDQIINLINKNYNKSLIIKYTKMPKKEYKDTCSSVDKITQKFNWKKNLNIKESIYSYKKFLRF